MMRVKFEAVKRNDVQGIWEASGLVFNDDNTPLVNAEGVQCQYIYRFPLDTLEWRAAEYELDPADTTTLLEIVLAESFMTQEDYNDDPPNLYDTDDIASARAGHIARAARVKLRHRLSRGGKNHPLRRIENESPLHQDVIDAKVRTRKMTRQQVIQTKNATSPLMDDQIRLASLTRQPTKGIR